MAKRSAPKTKAKTAAKPAAKTKTAKPAPPSARSAGAKARLVAARTKQFPPMLLPIDRITVGVRVRTDMGDIAGLASLINENGLLHPVVITPAGKLIAGERRMAAWRRSKFHGDPIPVRVVDIASIMRGEFAENSGRKDFTPSEAVAIKREMETEFNLKAEAAARMGKKAADAAPVTSKRRRAGTVAGQVGAFVGKSDRQIEKASRVVEAAERDPVRFGGLKDDMDRTGRVDGPYKRLTNMESGDAIRAEPPPLPGHGPYRAILIDPPWPSEPDDDRDPAARGYYPYKTMSIAAIADFPLPSIAHPDCAVWLLIPNFHLARGYHVPILERYGFKAVTILTWCKPGMGHGKRMRGATEHIILAIRGNVPPLGGKVKTWFEAKAIGKHSAKPPRLFEIIEAVTPAPRYAYLFAGKDARDGWDMHGDRVPAAAPVEASPDAPGAAPGVPAAPAAKGRGRGKNAPAATSGAGQAEKPRSDLRGALADIDKAGGGVAGVNAVELLALIARGWIRNVGRMKKGRERRVALTGVGRVQLAEYQPVAAPDALAIAADTELRHMLAYFETPEGINYVADGGAMVNEIGDAELQALRDRKWIAGKRKPHLTGAGRAALAQWREPAPLIEAPDDSKPGAAECDGGDPAPHTSEAPVEIEVVV